MAILPLPEDTVRKLGATLAISNPVQLVKELVENAFDAGATSVGVFVSSDTVSRIEVRDNGSGISPSDYHAIGRPGHTSKLRSLEDLADVGPKSFGFRGIAAASINAVANVMIATRTAKEPVASTLRLLRDGGVEEIGKKAAPVGTTVCVTKLFSNFPVRLPIVQRDSPKALSQIKQLLQSYAFVMPQTRLFFRTVESDQPILSYSPKAGTDVEEVVAQLLGGDVATRCCFETFSNTPQVTVTLNTRQTAVRNPVLGFQGCLPAPGADPGKLRHAAFIAVDSRPISSARGIGNKLASLFRKRFSCSVSGLEPSVALKDVFFQVNILCSPRSYDVNIEPAKNDVIFSDEEQVLEQFEGFLVSLYPPRTELASARNQSWQVDMSQAIDTASDGNGDSRPREPTNLRRPPSYVDAQEGDLTGREGKLNPWIIAKLGARDQPGQPGPINPARAAHEMPRQPPPPELVTLSHLSAREVHPHPSNIGWPPSTRPGPPLRGMKQLRPLKPDVVPGGTYRKPTIRSQGQQRTGPRARPITYTSSRGGRYQQRAEPVIPPPRPPLYTANMVQSTLSFGEQRRTEQQSKYRRVSRNPVPIASHAAAAASPSAFHGLKIETRKELQDAEKRTIEKDLLCRVDESPLLTAAVLTPNVEPDDDSREQMHQTAFPSEDARAYLIRRQRSIAEHPERKFRRVRTELLPLEAISRELETQRLALTLAVDLQNMSHQLLNHPALFEVRLADGCPKSSLEGDDCLFAQQRLVAFLSRSGVDGAAAVKLVRPGPRRRRSIRKK